MGRKGYVRFGSEAVMCGAIGNVRFTLESDRESGHRQTFMSALLPKADMCGANLNVRYGPIADIGSIATVQETAPKTRGKITRISANSPGLLSTSIEPPCCLTMMS